ncbi:MAG TPA: ABC transporter permease subunit [Stellaceae bacterium]|nr:ABC transporter permease subunit [Stellaceae bacterium]
MERIGGIDPARLLRRSALILILLLAWEGLARLHVFTPFLLPSLTTVLERLAKDTMTGQLPLSLALTLYRALLGFALAAACGVAVGVLIARVRFARWLFDPLVSVGLPMPKIAFLPIFVLWFGVFDESKILMVAFSAVFPVIVATAAATENVEKVLIWSARGLGTGERRLLWEIALPAAFPQIMTGLQVALPIALIVAVLAEMQMGGQGLGGDMMQASRFADSPGVFAGLVAIAIAGSALVKAMELIRRRLLVWHAEAEAGY